MADSFIDAVVRATRPFFLPLARVMARPKRGATWHYEAVVVALGLIIVAVLTSPSLVEAQQGIALKQFLVVWLSAGAVFASFLHAQVGTYMAEDMHHSEQPLTPCYHKLGEYWVYKEMLWFLVFLLSGAYPAIAGNVIFLLFPAWRQVYKEERRRLAASEAC